MELHWFDSDAVEIDDELELPQFKLDRFGTEECSKTYKTGESRCST